MSAERYDRFIEDCSLGKQDTLCMRLSRRFTIRAMVGPLEVVRPANFIGQDLSCDMSSCLHLSSFNATDNE